MMNTQKFAENFDPKAIDNVEAQTTVQWVDCNGIHSVVLTKPEFDLYTDYPSLFQLFVDVKKSVRKGSVK